MNLSEQRLDVLKIIKEKVEDKATARTIELLYKEIHKHIGNIYDVMTDLVAEGFVARVGKEYKITEKGADLLAGKKDEEEIAPIEFSAEEIESIKEYAKKNEVTETLPLMLNPGLMGLEKERLGCLLAMVSRNDEYGDNNRLHVLYEGTPGTGKTAIIKWADSELWGTYVDSDSKRAALKGTASGYQCKPGLLHDADGSVIYIDEIDKMDQKDQSALLGAMSSGMITINMDKVRDQRFNARVRCIATCNNREPLKAELLDRFDMQFSIKNLSKEEKERFIRRKLNDWNREKEVDHGDGFLKKYLEYARTLKVDFEDNREKIANHLIKQLDTGKLQGKEARKIESAIRLSLAVARLRLHKIVQEGDVKKALELMN